MYIIFDTETTGLPRDFKAPISDTDNWPRVIQLAWQLHDEMGNILEHQDYLVKPKGFDIPYDAEKIHGISTLLAEEQGEDLDFVLDKFQEALSKAKFIVGQNLRFDVNVMGCEFYRKNIDFDLTKIPLLDTCTEVTAELCALSGGRGGRFKLPTLTELHQKLFGVPFNEAHNATADVEATTRCFFELIRTGIFTPEQLNRDSTYISDFQAFHPQPIGYFGIKHLNLKEESKKLKQALEPEKDSISIDKDAARERLANATFAHLHNHTQFSILQSTIKVDKLVEKAASFDMEAVALTDTGNMMAAFHFEKAVATHNKNIAKEKVEAEENGTPFYKKSIKAIIGCEFNVCRDHEEKTTKDNGQQVVLLAKNKNGYHNLVKLSSRAFTHGFYYVPRVDRKLIEKYKEDLIILSGNLNGEIASTILNVGEKQAEESLLYWKEQFGADFYLEIMRHGQEDEDRVNATLIEFSKKHEVKLLAANSTHYLNEEDAPAHDILLCVRDNELVETPKGRGRGFRFGMPNDEYYFKSQEEMKELFLDLPEAIENCQEIIDKCENYGLSREVLLPAFDIPLEFQDELDSSDGGKRGENNFLRHLTYEGAKKRYGEITPELTERLDFELETIARTGYPGYFLIVQDFCNAAREMGVSVGPGRGSAAGSAVAYCTQITNVDPIEYDLLFERFLNPERVSMPDIDIDFDDEGRGRVIDYVINKYGSNQVAQIITYGTMAAKSSVRDTSRVLNLPLPEADRIAKMIPNLTLNKMFTMSDVQLAEKFKNSQDDYQKAKDLKRIWDGSDLASAVIKQATKLEGTVRNVGIHACGVIITPDDITNYVPVATAKDSDMYCTQYDNSVAESAGLLKMDFLGLKTLTLIKDAVKNVKERHNIDLDPDAFPKDDEKTYELFQRGETIGIFQYESPGMQKYMRELKPTVFADLIAMNALYRPGPLDYIPAFIKRKHGLEEIVYDIQDSEEFLKETYGITVYQEQVMLLSQKLAGFTKGEADTLRKAMGKKLIDVLNKMKPLFVKQGEERGHDPEKLNKIWKDWESFASYAFNKSHSTCYAWIAYQTAYLKAHYPAEYMSSVLSNNMSDIKQVTFFMDECKRMKIPVLGPDVNESNRNFTVNKEGAIRFGLGAIKGMGTSPTEEFIRERKENGTFKNIFDLTKRINLRICSKKAFESMAYAGGFDSFPNVHRGQFFEQDNSNRTFLENAMRFGAAHQDNENSAQISLFGDATDTQLLEPEIPKAREWGSVMKLNKEKEVIGIFISGHPLDDYRTEIDAFCKGSVSMLNEMDQHVGKEISIAAIVTESESRVTKNGDPFGTIIIEDYSDAYKMFLWKENYLKYRHLLGVNSFVVLRGRIEVPVRRKDLELNISSIELLSELKEKQAKMLEIKMQASMVNQLIISDLYRVLHEHSGTQCGLSFMISDELDGYTLKMPSANIRIEPTNELFNTLKQFDLEFKLT